MFEILAGGKTQRIVVKGVFWSAVDYQASVKYFCHLAGTCAYMNCVGAYCFPQVLGCWLGDRKGIWPVKKLGVVFTDVGSGGMQRI